jgi:hypothetical protein
MSQENNGGARFDDARLNALSQLLILEAKEVEPILEALFTDLVGAHADDTPTDRDRNAGLAMAAYGCLHIVRVGVRLEELNVLFSQRVDELEATIRARKEEEGKG